MTKADLVEQVSSRNGLTEKDVKIIVEGFLQEVKNCLVKGKSLGIRGFGAFKVKNRKARKARNPKTNEIVHIQARKKAFFKVSKEWNGMLR